MKNIEPIFWKRNSPNATQLEVRINHDDLATNCNLFWIASGVTEEEEVVILDSGNFVVDGEAYQNWDGNNDYPYQAVAASLGATLVQNNEE